MYTKTRDLPGTGKVVNKEAVAGATHVAGDPGSAASLRYALSGMTGGSRTHPDLIGRRCRITLLGHVAMDKRCYRRKTPELGQGP
ncbi:MAG: hypothetical protein FH748_14790 [Balneolaceae bacterium]|nr:hypothetical protein [Balneolaceae bacterium]